MVEKLDMKTANYADLNVTKIAQIFPNCITTTIDETGNMKQAIDFDLLKQELSNNIVDGIKERYRLEWPGKKEAIVAANKTINKTLRPITIESTKFYNTKNIYIEGDNLETLKLLQEAYLNKVKMIYIDPPYNTGKDFVYKDNFTKEKDEELENTGQKNEEGKLVANLDSNGRYHSDWLSMIYPRLKLSRNLLKQNGVVFISIDHNEVGNLRKVCDEIFGSNNFIGELPRVTKKAGKSSDYLSNNHDYILCYQKSSFTKLNKFEHDDDGFKFVDEFYEERGKYKLNQTLDYNTLGYVSSLDYPIEIDGDIYYPGGVSEEEYKLRKTTNPKDDFRWRWSQDLFEYGLKNGFVVVKKYDNYSRIYTKTYQNATISKDSNNYYIEFLARTKPLTSLDLIENKYSNDNSRKDLSKLFDKNVFDYSKPVSLLKLLTYLGTDKNSNDIVLDFFSGSSTTAHAMMQLNAEDGGNRRFIMVQIPEETDEKSEAYKAGYKTICEIGKERIRRAGKKILEENKDKEGIENLDIGFRVFKVDSSNMKDVYYNPDEIRQDNLFDMVSNIKEDRTDLDLLFQVLLDSGVELTLPIEEKQIAGKKVYFVDGNVLAACFEDNLTEEFVTELAQCEDLLKVVFRDSSFGSDDSRINVEQIFKQYSPDTQIRVI